MFYDLIRNNRSYRRFYQQERINRETMTRLLDYARLSPSGANRQAIKYYISYEEDTNAKVFPALLWAAYLPDWNGPVDGERPAGYIVMVQEAEHKMVSGIDHGIAAQSILLGATELGLGGCMFGNIRELELRSALNIPDHHQILLAIAIGKPKETVVIDEIDPLGDIKYWRDSQQVHHVPKRKLKDIMMN